MDSARIEVLMMPCAAQAHTHREAAALGLEKFLDKVNHDVLMACLKRKIADRRLLYYIRQMLKAEVIDERGIRHEREEGTPQGWPLSPLPANVLPDDFDKESERRGHKFCRYAAGVIIIIYWQR